jgi:hypothetical protein
MLQNSLNQQVSIPVMGGQQQEKLGEGYVLAEESSKVS